MDNRHARTCVWTSRNINISMCVTTTCNTTNPDLLWHVPGAADASDALLFPPSRPLVGKCGKSGVENIGKKGSSEKIILY